ncbi:MAG: hypothetical protein JNL80_06350 [Phycisphaerae bacterium]|jgi:hypothetical protein|nr:hypothetical protein [Phycisphaerae bacterium]
MNCRTCGFCLWNTQSRICPECGTPFRPSEFEFRPAAVHYGCPHCGTGYLGMSPKGHLEPSEFTCSVCKERCAMDEMVLSPAPGSTSPELVSNTWIGRRTQFGPFFSTLRDILVRPREFAMTVPLRAPTRDALAFFGLGAGLMFVAVVGSQLCWVTVVSAILSSAGQGVPRVGMMGMGGFGIAGLSLVLGLLLTLVVLFGESTIIHLFLRSPARNVPLSHTRQLYLYFMGTWGAVSCLSVIPCLGSLVSTAWFFFAFYVTAALMRGAYQSSMGRAVLAVIVARVVSIILVTLLTLVAIVGMPRAFGLPVGIFSRIFQVSGPTGIAAALLDHRQANGTWPATPLDLVVNDPTIGFDLLSMVSGEGSGGSIGAVDFNVVWSGNTAVINAERAALAARIPPGQAFRLGNVTFYYPLTSGGANEWLFVTQSSATGVSLVYTGQGRIVFTGGSWAAALAAENARRAATGLPPLPDPASLPDLNPSSSNPNAGPVAPQESGEEEEPAGDQLDAETDPDAGKP